MPANNNRKEYIDIPINLEQAPLCLFQKFTTPTVPVEHIDIGLEFIQLIDKAIRSPDCPEQLLHLYFNHHQSVSNNQFAEKDWPAVHEIETVYEDKDFNAKVQAIYNELRLRSKFQRLRKGQPKEFINVADEAWENYQSILERQSKQVAFPPLVAWDIMENFLSQFSVYHEMKLSLKGKVELPDDVFDLVRSKKILEQLVKFIPAEPPKLPTSKQTFGYFALLASATIEVYSGKYKQGLAIISRLSLQHLAVYSKAIGALLTLFLTASYAYFMLEQYKESARVAETAILFLQKNKKYFSSPALQTSLTLTFQKLSTLLCLSFIMLQQKPKPIITELFKTVTLKKDKLSKQKLSDKYNKLKQYDHITFGKLFKFCSLPSINRDIREICDAACGKFKLMQNITLNTILQHYTQISVAKIANMLKITEAQVLNQIESFNNISTGSAPWDRTIMEPLLSHTRKLHVQVLDGILKLDTDQTNIHEGMFEWQQYHQQIGWLVQKVAAL